VVADLSFISLRLAVGPLAAVAAAGADVVLLVKPQFEAGPADVGRGGVVRDPEIWRRAVEDVAQACADAGVAPVAVMASPLRGPAGNVEFLLHARVGGEPGTLDVETAIAESEAASVG
jgi:23S rRNA (cytidine1920-2'-O)/16S rRNA (cytidine1409-2'-O)-methyltransferase